MPEKAGPRKRFLFSISNTLTQLVDDGITDLVVTMASAVPYALVMRHLAQKQFQKRHPINFLIYDPSLHPQSNRPHQFTGKQNELYDKQLRRFQRYFRDRKNCQVGVFDESGYRMTGQSIHLTEEQIGRICHQSVKRYTCGAKGLLASRNAESTSGKLFMREEEFTTAADNGRREFLGRDLKSHIYRGSRDQFSSLEENLLIQYIEFRGCWRAVGKCAKIMITGYNKVSEEIHQLLG